MKNGLKLLTVYSTGIAGIFLAGFFSEYMNLWQSCLAAFIVSGIFVLHLFRLQFTDNRTGRKKAALSSALIILFSLQAVASYLLYEKSVKNRVLLRDIRTHISETLAKMEMEKALQHTLRTYYFFEGNSKSESLEATFKKLLDDRIANDNILSASVPGNNEDFSIYYDFASPDSIILTVVGNVAYGMDPEFDNFNNKTGMFQATSTLTLNGSTYAREN